VNTANREQCRLLVEVSRALSRHDEQTLALTQLFHTRKAAALMVARVKQILLSG
jgi:hypothetical protein